MKTVTIIGLCAAAAAALVTARAVFCPKGRRCT